MSQTKTLTGFTEQQVYEILAAVLPPECYAPVPGGADLTDIDPVARDVVFNKVFGVCGRGWVFSYDVIQIEPVTRKGGSSAFCGFVSPGIGFAHAKDSHPRIPRSAPLRIQANKPPARR